MFSYLTNTTNTLNHSLLILFLLDAERKLAFLDVEGFDIFGKNSLFAPLIRWETFYKDIDNIKKAAGDYEKAFNDIITSVNNKNDLKQVKSYFFLATVKKWIIWTNTVYRDEQ